MPRATLSLALLAASTALMGAAPPSGGAAAPPNPFAQASTLPFHAPRFDLIKDADYQPAFETAMAEQISEMRKIADDPATPTFDNTIVPMERSGRMLDRVASTFFGVVQANTNDTLDKVQAAMAPKLAGHQDEINLDPKLFQRVSAVYARKDSLPLGPEQRQLLEVYYQQFVHAGAKLDDADKAKLRDLNKQLSTLETSFQQTLLAATKAGALVADDKAMLAGLDDAEIAAAAQAARDRKLDGKWLLPLQNTTRQPALVSLSDRATRQALFEHSWTRAEQGGATDTRAIVAQLAQLRARKAALLGYPTWGDYVLFDQMAKTPDAAIKFVDQFAPAVAAEQKREAAEIQAEIKRGGESFDLKPWDWERYAERIRKAKYDLDQDQLKPYFEIHHVLEDGVFFAANQLYGLTFKKRTDIPVYQPDVITYTVYDKDGSELGLMYFDYWKRDNKTGGAWMSNFVGQSTLLGTKPVIYNVANFTKPAPGQPALITSDDVITMFHEFGHALHGLFASQVYPSLSGTAVARDFVEYPSQFNEYWALEPRVLANYAKDYRTGAPIPPALVEKIKRAQKFNQGFELGEQLEASSLDLAWHALPASAPRQDVDKFETDALARSGFASNIVPPRYRSSYFQHIWAGGYSAGYYAYAWTKMLKDDTFEWFHTHGGMTRANGERFRAMILSKGHTEDYGPMFRAFYGKDPDVGPMLIHYGFKPGDY